MPVTGGLRPRPAGRPAARPRLDPRRVAVARLGAEAVLLDLQTYRATRANAAAALILRLANGCRDEAALAAALAAEFDLGPRRARADVRRLLRALQRRGFLAPGPE